MTPLAVNNIGMLNLVEINATKDVAGRLGNDTDRLNYQRRLFGLLLKTTLMIV